MLQEPILKLHLDLQRTLAKQKLRDIVPSPRELLYLKLDYM
jgi:hypothetical protein